MFRMKIKNCISNSLRVYFSKSYVSIVFANPVLFRSMMKYVSVLLLLLSLHEKSFSAPMVDSLVYSQSFNDTTKKDGSLSFDIDLKTELGKIILAPGKTKNLARGSKMKTIFAGPYPTITVGNETKPDTGKMNADNLNDNSFFTYVQFPPNNVGSQIKIDLRVVRKVDSIVVIHLLNQTVAGFNFRPLAFSYYTGIDSNRMSRVRQVFDNLDSARHSEKLADPDPIQYITFELDRMSTTNATVISEFQIFGEGYVVEGAYVSKIDSTGTFPSNFANVYLDGDIEPGTTVAVEMRTGSKKTFDSLSWSRWSSPIVFHSSAEAAAGAPLFVSEPRKYFQYRLTLGTINLLTPKVRSVKFVYQNSLIADSTSALITPRDIPVLIPAVLTYSIKTNFSATSLGVDTIKISTPGPSNVRSVAVDGIPVAYNFLPAPNVMTVAFQQTLLSTATITIIFSTKLVDAGTFPSTLVSKAAPWNPQRIDPQQTQNGDGWIVTTAGVPMNPIDDIKISPNPFTPNGDGKNDLTIIDFAVTKIDKPKPLRIAIFELSGRKVRTVVDVVTGVNPFFGDPRGGGKAFTWDGRDDNGKVVLPGIYILQVSLDVDNGGQFITKTITVAY